MKIKTVHAFFVLNLNNSNKEKIGFTVSLDEGETPESVVPQLREQAVKIVGKSAYAMYTERADLETECEQLEKRLNLLRKEWDATAEFLKAQGLNPSAPSMPQFRNLLTAVTIESTVVNESNEDEEDEDYYEEDEEEED
ncbi:MAG: hypothetical protein RMY62_014740 [Nostoc sp. ZfuVER08]|nr:hypothetical protein [Nostoc sp. ZfuVER08]